MSHNKTHLKHISVSFLLAAVMLVTQSCSKKTISPAGSAGVNSFSVANILQSNMVVQRDKPFSIWGKAKSGQKVTAKASWNAETFESTANASGNWKATIPPAPANSASQTITINTKDKTPVVFNNILIGDVWVCSGQSNMVMQVAPSIASFRGVPDYETEIAAANFPLIREFNVPESYRNNPVDTLASAQTWQVCSPATAGKISAVAYFFAKKLQPALNVPVGIIVSAVNGTRCNLWTNKTVFDNDPSLAAIYGGGASQLYNGMIHPLTALPIKGFLWYQGESNWSDNPANYAKLNAGLILGWRQAFNQGQLPFYYVQMAPFAKDHHTEPGGGDLSLFDYALFREGQASIVNMVQGTGMAITLDAGEVLNHHPRNKKPVGERLALLALQNTYMQSVNAYGPQYKSHIQSGKTITITFDHADGLTTLLGAPLNQHFYVAGDNHVFVNAPAIIQGNTIVLTVPGAISGVVAVRYAFTNAAITNIQNGDGLPMEQFRTDNW